MLRVLFTGDSVTHALDGDYSYRLRVFEEFRRQGVPVNFVGSRNRPFYPPGGQPASYLVPFDTDHFALGATTLQSQVKAVGAEIAKQKPDVVVELLGLNDLRHGKSPAETAALLEQWIAAVRGAKPNTKIVLMQIPSVPASMGSWHAKLPAYNALLPGVVQRLTTTQSPIVVAETARGWDSPRFSYDNVHLTATGETFFAQRISEALVTLGVLANKPLGWRTLPWNRNLKAVVTPRVGGAELRWNQRGISGVRIWVRRAGQKGRMLPRTYTGYKRTITGLKQGATYEFRLIAVRFRHESTLGPVARKRTLRQAPPRVGRVSISSRGVRWSGAARATSYIVKVKRAGSGSWRTKRVSSSHRTWRVSRVVKARVWAVNSGGRSPVRQAVR